MEYKTIEVKEPDQLEKEVNPERIYVAQEGTIVHITLKPGATLPSHKTPVNVVFYVLEGAIQIDIGDESKVFTPNQMIESPKEIPHALTNADSESIARILVIKMPSP